MGTVARTATANTIQAVLTAEGVQYTFRIAPDLNNPAPASQTTGRSHHKGAQGQVWADVESTTAASSSGGLEGEVSGGIVPTFVVTPGTVTGGATPLSSKFVYQFAKETPT